MIDREAFKAEWALLLDRFSREPEPRQQAAYFEYLSPQLTTEEFRAAARSLWATAKWWPRPADFLLVNAAGEWEVVLLCIEGYRAPDWPWAVHWKRLTVRAQAACRSLGGMESLKTLFGKDAVKAKTEWEKAYEQATAAQALALPASTGLRLPAGTAP